MPFDKFRSYQKLLRITAYKLRLYPSLEGYRNFDGRSCIAPFSPFVGPNGLTRSAGRMKRLVEVDFNVKLSIVLDARHMFVKLFRRHTHVKKPPQKL